MKQYPNDDVKIYKAETADSTLSEKLIFENIETIISLAVSYRLQRFYLEAFDYK